MTTNFFAKRRPLMTASMIVVLGAAAAGVLFLRLPAAQSKAAQAGPAAIPVPVATLAENQITTWDEFSGRLEAVDRVEVRSRVAGAVLAAHFVEGAPVRRGDLLFTIDPAPFQAEVDRAQARVVAAQARVQYTRSERERAAHLWEESALAQRELEARINANQEAVASLRAAEAELQTARLNLGYTQVRAPISGRVGRREVTAGNLVAAGPGAPVLTTLVSVDPIYASFDADEQVVARVLADLPPSSERRARLAKVPVQMATDTTGSAVLTGHLQLVDNQVNAGSGTVRVRAVFDNAHGTLIPGQFASLRLGRAKTVPAVLVSERAIGTDQDKKFVFVVGADNRASYREVSLGATANGLRIVKAGLTAGERIVVSGLQRIRPGALVAPQPAAMETRRDEPEQRKALARS